MSAPNVMATLVGAFAVVAAVAGCQFPYPADVPGPGEDARGPDAASPPGRSIGGAVDGLWNGGTIGLHLQAGDVQEDLAVGAAEQFTFASRLPDDASYVVTVVASGADHECAVTNGSGRVQGADVTEVDVACTNLVPHAMSISSAVAFTFDPRTTRYPLPASLLQQEVSVLVSGPTLTSALVEGGPVSIGQASSPVAIDDAGAFEVAVEIAKGALSRRYDLVFDRGARPIAEALYGRASNPGNGDGFGIAIAASADYIAVGAWMEDSSTTAGVDNATTDSGAVYLFRRVGDAWTFSQRLKGSAITTTRHFGHALAIDADVLVVGAYGDDARGTDAGAVHVFRLAGGQWSEEQRLVASDARAGDQFGFSVGVSGGIIAVGSPFHELVLGSGTSGAVYTFSRVGTMWAAEPAFRPPSSGLYGWRLALDGDSLALGGMLHDPVHVYRRSQGSWIRESLPAVTGASVDIHQDVLAIGQPFSNTPGAVRVFTRVGGVWSQTGLLQATPATGGNRLGNFVAIRGDLIVTSDTNAPAYLFQRVGGSWVPLPQLSLSGSPVQIIGGGPKVDISGNAVVVGNFEDGGPGNALPGSGTVWMFR